MEETRVLLGRLERIRRLDRSRAEPAEIVAELRALLVEAEEWARAEGGDTGVRAAAELRAAVERADASVSSARVPAA